MKKRQRKKNIKRAIRNVNSGNATKRDRHILRTYGRKEFKTRYILPPELIGFDVQDIINNVATAFRRIGLSFGQAVENIGKNIQSTFETKTIGRGKEEVE